MQQRPVSPSPSLDPGYQDSDDDDDDDRPFDDDYYDVYRWPHNNINGLLT